MRRGATGLWRRALAVLLVLGTLSVAAPRTATGQGIQLATDAPQPLTPEQSRQLFRLAPGFRVELVASEPLLADPVAMAFDAAGRILVCEIHGYNLEGYLDIHALNETGALDTQVRRILANDDATKRAAEEQYGTVKLLEDLDGDGRMDRATVLADRLPPCYGVVPARGGVIVFCAPDIVFLADRDGDGTAEVRETLFTGFGVGEMWTRINNPRWGLDNWIYGVSGAGSAGTVRGPRLPGEVRLGSTCFRFRSDGSELEACSGQTSGFGQALDDWNDRFLCTNQQHALYVVPISHHYLVRNPYYAAPNLTVNISTYGHPARVYPTSLPDPWRRARAADPAWVRFYGEAEATANGYFTAASGQDIYQGDQFPPEYRGNHFSVDNAQNLIHRCLLEENGVLFDVRRPMPTEETEFLTSTEQWFRPVNLMNGPDGALYVVDMYRDIIEDYSAIPRYLQQQYIQSLIAGADKGRIWRIVADRTPLRRPTNLEQAATDALVRSLTDACFWTRVTAQRLIVERQDTTVVPLLEGLARRGSTAQARLHALFALDGLSALHADLVALLLADAHHAVRVHALRVAERLWDEHPELLAAAAKLVHDPHPRVRLQLALSLGETNRADAEAALRQLALRCGNEPWMAAAILSSAVESADGLLASALLDAAPGSRTRALWRPLASIVGSRRDEGQVGRVLQTLGELPPGDGAAEKQAECLAGLLEGLERGGASATSAPTAAAGLRLLLASSDARVREPAARAARLLRLEQTPEMKAIVVDAGRTALDETQPSEARARAARLLAAAPPDDLRTFADRLLDHRQPIEVQLATVEALGTADDPAAMSLLLDKFPSFTPRLSAAVMDAFFAKQERLPMLLDALEQSAIPASSLDAVRRDQLNNSPKSEIAARARKLLAPEKGTAERQSVLDHYASGLRLPRDAARGKAVFDKQCAKCHKLGGEGYEVGPDLLTAKTRSDETLLSDIMDPSSQITVGYGQYTVITETGRIFNGVLAAETATGVTLRAEENKETVLLRKEIDEMAASRVSMMPEDLEKQVTPQDIADLIGFLRQSLGPTLPSRLVLVDDDPAFPLTLTEGDGRVWLESTDAHAGNAALAVAPPQRFAAKIPGWEFRVAEQPALGEFRYLRFAWKQPAGDGVMLELAADGGWPEPHESRCRYYSGRNTTDWDAVQVAADRPVEWTVVTRDLWRDFGSFTLTGIAPTAMGGVALFDRVELLRSLDEAE